jgi:hypothetical protein
MTGFVIFIIVFIVLGVISKARQSARSSGQPSPRVQAIINRLQEQAQQNGGPPLELGPKYAKYANGAQSAGYTGPVQASQPGNPPTSQQVAATLGALLQAGRQPSQHQQSAPVPYRTQPQHQPQFQPQYQPQYQPPATWMPSNQPPAHRPPQNNLPASNADLDARVRELMRTRNEVGAIRLLCDERDLGIIEAQKYARSLVAPAKTKSTSGSDDYDSDADGGEETRYIGSAAFATSTFDLDRDDDVWASGWVDTPEPEDRSDIDELWQTVQNPPRPGVTPAS